MRDGDVTLPFTVQPSFAKLAASGNPDQPHPKMLTFVFLIKTLPHPAKPKKKLIVILGTTFAAAR